tara:strand:- start:657 stop:812 length:156 start_codon:yes stop_codon:yes gene_type:complete
MFNFIFKKKAIRKKVFDIIITRKIIEGTIPINYLHIDAQKVIDISFDCIFE